MRYVLFSVSSYGRRLKFLPIREPKHVQWVNLYVEIFDGLSAYIKEYHTTGLTWNPKVRAHSRPFLVGGNPTCIYVS